MSRKVYGKLYSLWKQRDLAERILLQMPNDHHIRIGGRLFLTAIKHGKPTAAKRNIPVLPAGLRFRGVIVSAAGCTAKVNTGIRAAERTGKPFCQIFCVNRIIYRIK